MTCRDSVRRIALVGGILALSVGVCGPARAQNQVAVGRRALLNFSLPDLNGRVVNLAAATRGRPLLLSFWSGT